MSDLTRQQVRDVDRYAIEVLGIDGLVLMENAGRQSADAVGEYLQTIGGSCVAIVAGAGNNGGDGFVVARHLAMRGVSVSTFLVARPKRISGDAAANLAVIRKLNHDIREISSDDIADLAGELSEFDVLVDAIGGTGIFGELRGDIAEAVNQVNAAGRPVVAIDIPTGLDCDTGEAAGPAVKAELTVTFVARKVGFDSPSARQYTGRVQVADIGVSPDICDT